MKLMAIAIAAGTLFGSSLTLAQEPAPSAYRLYKLCEAQDPQCLPMQRQLVREIVAVNPDCLYTPVSDERLWTVFMQVTRQDLTILRLSPLTVETQVFSIATGCVHRLPAAVAAEMPPPRPVQPDAVRPKRMPESGAADMIRQIALMQRKCEQTRDAGWCRNVDREVDRLKRLDWCLQHDADPGVRQSWRPCDPAQ